MVGFNKVSYIIIESGTVTIDGIDHTGNVDCREMEGLHTLEATGQWIFKQMTKEDYDYVKNKRLAEKDAEILNLQAEVVELEYQKALEVINNV